MKKALITGITGQDGSYLADFLLDKGYEVHGIKRRASSINTQRLDHIYEDPHTDSQSLFLHYSDMSDASSLLKIISEVRPDEIYNLAAQSHVGVSFSSPEFTSDIDALGTLRILDAIVATNQRNIKFYQASSSELYGLVRETPQSETTPFYPRSPYAVSKLYAYWITVNYRESYDLFAANGILFNHESPRRGETFVTRKITRGLSRIYYGLEECLYLGNIYAKRDWGHAKDFIEAQWVIMQHDKADDFVIATGEQYSVKEFVNYTLSKLGIEIEWSGKDLNEIATVRSVETNVKNVKPGDVIIRIDSRYYRPSEVDTLLGDYSKAKKILGWSPRISFEELVDEMITYDLDQAAKEFKLSN